MQGGRQHVEPGVEGGLRTDSGGPHVVIRWEPGTGRGAPLPAGYFRAVTVVKPSGIKDDPYADNHFVASVVATGDREITLRLNDLASLGAVPDQTPAQQSTTGRGQPFP